MATTQTVKRRQYQQAYYRRNKLAALAAKKRWEDSQRHRCVGVEGVPCDAIISRLAKRCQAHAHLDHSRKQKAARRAVKTSPPCPACHTTMQPRMWHETSFLRCGGCGLETTVTELRRINFENRMKIEADEPSMLRAEPEVRDVAA